MRGMVTAASVLRRIALTRFRLSMNVRTRRSKRKKIMANKVYIRDGVENGLDVDDTRAGEI
jgi:hypothetical protein